MTNPPSPQRLREAADTISALLKSADYSDSSAEYGLVSAKHLRREADVLEAPNG